MSSFHVTLCSADSSNASTMSLYGMEFRTMLQRELFLPDDDWHVALSSMQYTGQKWGYLSDNERTFFIVYNIPKPCEIVTDLEIGSLWLLGSDKNSPVHIEKSFYAWDQFKGILCKAIEKVGFAATFANNTLTVSHKTGNEHCIVLSSALAVVLGFLTEDFGIDYSLMLPVDVEKISLTCSPKVLDRISEYVKIDETLTDAIEVNGAYGPNPTKVKEPSVSIPVGCWPIHSLLTYINRLPLVAYCKIGIENVTQQMQIDGNIKLEGTFTTMPYNVDVKVKLSEQFKKVMSLGNGVANTTSLLLVYKFSYSMNVINKNQPTKVFLARSAFGSAMTLCDAITGAITRTMEKEILVFKFLNDAVHIQAPYKSAYKLAIHNHLYEKFALSAGLNRPDANIYNDLKTDRKLLTFSRGEASGGTISINHDMAIQRHDKSGYIESKTIPAFWVYTDIIEDQMVSTDMAPLLRIVPNNAPEGQPYVEALEAYYVPLSRKRIAAINIKVCVPHKNELIYFDNDITCVLHFMRKPI